MAFDRSSGLRRTISEIGTTSAILYYVGEMLARVTGRHVFIRRYLFVAQPVPAAPLVKRPDPATRVRQVSADDPAVPAFPRPAEVIRNRFASGGTCLEITVDNSFAGFLWLAFGAYEEDEVRCRYELADKTRLSWDFDVYVEPHYRLGRTFARLWDGANQFLRERGVQWSLSRISAFNAASLTAHARLGAAPLGHATFLCAGRFQLAFIPGRRVPKLSWNHASRPTLVLRGPIDQTKAAANF